MLPHFTHMVVYKVSCIYLKKQKEWICFVFTEMNAQLVIPNQSTDV